MGPAQVPGLNELSRIKQAGSKLSGFHTEMLISQLRCHSAARRAIKEADLNQVWLDDFFD